MLNKVVDKNLKVWYNMCIEQRTFYVCRNPTDCYPRRRFDCETLMKMPKMPKMATPTKNMKPPALPMKKAPGMKLPPIKKK